MPAGAPAGSPTAAAGSSGDPPVPKGKAKSSAAKGKAKMKAAAKPLKVGVLELARAKASDIKDALPRYNRSETKKSLSNEIMAKVMPRMFIGLRG